ncbi:ATP-binding protein [Caballeronia sordidicola]|uniref:Helicase HerA central domain-containing protein n=1 Tax=Caballeronia sordidicola TaxID=196367 RepID=A0A242N7C8_CABSO|nr:ATP-binding protein [Caballeronia sordidicola]OTP79066.1 hypothetical protein PAMC26510_06290 [Caballeronia sordidicola]
METSFVLTLAGLVRQYFSELKTGGVECRMVIPALTPDIAVALQAALVSHDLPSYLVVPDSMVPSRENRWIRAEAVTSVRQGDMLVVVWPGEMSRIQDSVIGVGGATRNFAFSDEWPWIDDGNQYFQFDGPVLKSLVERWGIDAEAKQGFFHIVKAAQNDCRGSMRRGQVFLDEMLGAFRPEEPDVLLPLQRLLFHFGIPRCTTSNLSAPDGAKAFFSNVRGVAVELDRRLKEVGGKQEILDRIKDLKLEPAEASSQRSSLSAFLDAFTTRGDDKQQGILALRGCWNDLDSWRTWDLRALQNVLDVAPDIENVEVRVEVIARAGLVSDDAKSVILLDGGQIDLKIDYTGLVGDISSAKVVVRGRARSPLFEEPCVAPAVTYETFVSYDQLFDATDSLKKKSVRITVERSGRVLASARVGVVPCGPNQPLVALLEPGGKCLVGRDDQQPSDSGDGGETIEVSEPATLTIVAWDSFADGEIEIDGELRALQQEGEERRVLRLPTAIDPDTSGSGRSSVNLRSSGLTLSFDVEAKEISRGEFTLERELVMQLARYQRDGKKATIKRILEVCSGNTSHGYSGLGGLDESTRSRRRFAQAFEGGDLLGRPILTDLLSGLCGTPFNIEESSVCRSELAELPPILKRANISPEAQQIVNRYVAERELVMDIIRSVFANDSSWPDYAFLPIFSLSTRVELEPALVSYLDAYIAALEFVRDQIDVLSWPELFRIVYSDCVVHWDEGASSRKIVLIGPWHPITLAKRYMVQSALTASAKRHVDGTTTGPSQMLALLLDQVNAARWFAGIADDGKTFENFYVTATSDPGWLVAMSHQVIGDDRYLRAAESLRHLHGFEIGMVPASRELVAQGYLQDFFNAFPTRRAISVVADASYDPSRLVESAQRILYDVEGPSDVGRLLPGGIHIMVPNANSLDQQEWREPPICVYEGAASGNGNRFSDINLISPGRAGSARDSGDRPTLPRGRGLLAAFCGPVKEVGISANGGLQSRAFERDRALAQGTGLGQRFSHACWLLSELVNEPRVISWQADLPPTLDYLWTVVPGNHVDPAVFVKYVLTSAESGESVALWDYKMSLTGALNSYFVMSKIPPSISYELNRSPILQGKPLAPAVLSELGRVGMALGGESLRSGSRALGVVGVVAAVRLFFPVAEGRLPLRNDDVYRGFLLPVDSFQELLGGAFDGEDDRPRQRGDLVAIQLTIRGDGGVSISCSSIECKYSTSGLSREQIEGARQQADATLRRLLNLIDVSRRPDGIPERLAFLSLVTFGLRLSKALVTGDLSAQMSVEAAIIQGILDGRIHTILPAAGNIVVVTDCSASAASYTQGQALVITLAPGHWPGISESSSLSSVREKLSENFRALFVSGSEIPDATVDRGLAPVSKQVEGVKVPTEDQEFPTIIETAEFANVQTIPPTSELSRQPSVGDDEGEAAPRVVALQKILVGTAGPNAAFYDPQNQERPLDNYNIMVTGSSGKGKTQLIKMLVCRLREQGRNVLLLDFKNDFASDQHFLQTAQLRGQYVTFDGLPFNPLIPVPLRRPDSEVEYLPISEHINGLVDILRSTFGLGDQQEVAVKNAIRDAFGDRGIPSRGSIVASPNMDFPDFNEVGVKLASSNPAAYNRLDPLFDLGIFPVQSRLKRFDSMLTGAYVVDLSQIQSDRIKNAVAKVLVMSAHRFYNAREHSGVLRQFFVFDEAHRVLDSEFVLQFVRECRAYGVGVVLSSQYPSDFPADISASLNTKFLHGNGADKARVRDIGKLVGGSLPDESIERLAMFEAILANPQYEPTLIKTIGYPAMLVLNAIRKAPGSIHRRDLTVAGVDVSRLNVEFLLTGLIEMGLVEETAAGLNLKVH